MIMKTKVQRLGEFHQALVSDPTIPSTAMEAYAFLRQHLDAVELAALPAKLHLDFTTRMMIPSFEIAGAWTRNGSCQEWQAFGHIARISYAGRIAIKTKSGQPWFSRP